MKTYRGKIETKFFWLIPFIIGVSKSNIDNKANVYALHITPFFEIGFNWKQIKGQVAQLVDDWCWAEAPPKVYRFESYPDYNE